MTNIHGTNKNIFVIIETKQSSVRNPSVNSFFFNFKISQIMFKIMIIISEYHPRRRIGVVFLDIFFPFSEHIEQLLFIANR